MQQLTGNEFQELKLIFENNLNVSLISENITFCSLDDDAISIKSEMEKKDFDVYGVKSDDGIIVGYIEKSKLDIGDIRKYYKKFEPDNLLSNSTSLLTLLNIFQYKERMFVLENNTIEKIVTIADLHKQPIRMLIFSFISLLEMYLTTIIEHTFCEDEWTKKITTKRLEYTQDQFKNRSEKNEALTLLENTQLCDKGTIIQKSSRLRKHLGFESKAECKCFFKELEELRNNTAHAQGNIYHNNSDLLKLVLKIQKIIEVV